MIVEERDRMKKSSITLGYDEERLSAARLYLKRRGLTLEEEMAAHLDRLYEKACAAGGAGIYRGERRSRPGEVKGKGGGKASLREQKFGIEIEMTGLSRVRGGAGAGRSFSYRGGACGRRLRHVHRPGRAEPAVEAGQRREHRLPD